MLHVIVEAMVEHVLSLLPTERKIAHFVSYQSRPSISSALKGKRGGGDDRSIYLFGWLHTLTPESDWLS
jgi:hypothetical protein